LKGTRRKVEKLLQDALSPKVMDVLRQAGMQADRLGYDAYVVGGFVRDLLLGIDNLDIDVVVEGDGITFAQALAKDKKATVTVHDRFGTAVMRFPDGFKLDVATARTEYYNYPAALPKVTASSIEKDLARRDFTINTLAVRLNPGGFGRLVDLYGGQGDLKKRMIRVLHRLSVVEDPTRVFRAIRFELRLGFHLSEETLDLIEGAVKMNLFQRLSAERLLNELRRLFAEPTARHAVRRLAELDLLQFIHPRLVWSSRLDQRLLEIEEALDWYGRSGLDRPINRWLLYVMALAEVLTARSLRELLGRFPFTEAERCAIVELRATASAISRQLSRRLRRPSEVARLLKSPSDETLIFLLARNKTAVAKRQIMAYLTIYRAVRPLLTGNDLHALHVQPGPLYGTILTRLREARLDGEVASEAEERDLVKRMVKEHRAVKEESAYRFQSCRGDR
jgi:tRNA nucleotidyltransferase (CCA-adding enzyme)